MSALAKYGEEYLALRRALGYRLEDDGRLLADFLDCMERTGTDHVSVDAALAWATDHDGSVNRKAGRLAVVRHFAAYVKVFDDNTEIPPADLLRQKYARGTPYLFSASEIAALMEAAAEIDPPLWAASFETLIGLMAATGLRTGEAWRLDRCDVDFDSAVLTVRHSKFDKSRQVPVHETTVDALARYVKERDRLCPHPATPAFLVTAAGERLGGYKVSRTFRSLLGQVGIAAAPTRRLPRLHDLRHSFAVATLLSWHADNVDVEPLLPTLSTYMGHLNPENTYWYLEAAPELMAVVARRVESFWRLP